MKSYNIFSGICCAIIFILMALLVVIISNHEKFKANEQHHYIPIETQPEETIDVTEITMDKSNFTCFGDIDLEISDLGVVTFTCKTEEKKVIITANPVELFITQYIKTTDQQDTTEEIE
jgi:hypothetical protein